MKTTNTTKTTTAAANAWIFGLDSITVNGHTFPASYSRSIKTGDVYVFATVQAAADAPAMPVRLHISASMPQYADAAAAADAAAKAGKAPAPVDAPAPVESAPVESAPVEAPAPVDAPAAPAKKPSRKRSAPRPQDVPAPVESAPVEVPAAPAAPADKPWIGSTLTGKGWTIAFDATAGRTRVQVEGTPTAAQRAAIEQAGFYWSAQLQSWNKKLTCKAYRAAQALASTLNALA